MSFKNIGIIGLSGSQKLAKLIAQHLKIKLIDTTISHFADGEILVCPNETVRHKKIVIIQSISKPVNENLMELLVCIDSLKRAYVKEIVTIIPYLAYARQDRKSRGREPITAKLIANLLQIAGVNHVVTIDVHTEQIQGFYEIPFDSLRLWSLGVSKFLKIVHTNLALVSPDYGSVKRVREVSQFIPNASIIILDKKRVRPNTAEILNILGDTKNKNCLIVDDIIDTAGTICEAAIALKKNGAKTVNIVATHGLFSRDALDRIQNLMKQHIIDKIYVTNTIESVYKIKNKNFKIVDVSSYLADVIKIIFSENQSLSQYANKKNNFINFYKK